MKKILLGVCLLTTLLSAQKVRASDAFPILDFFVTPLPVIDIRSTPALGAGSIENIVAALAAIEDFLNREELGMVMSEDGPGLTKRSVEKIDPPEIEPIKGAADTDISLLEKGGVDIKNPKKTAEFIEKELMITEETSSEGVKKERSVRNKFAQDNAISAMANALYFDSKVAELQKTVDKLSSTTSKADKFGALMANFRYFSAMYRLLTLLEQIKAERLQLKAAQGIMEALPVKEPIVG